MSQQLITPCLAFPCPESAIPPEPNNLINKRAGESDATRQALASFVSFFSSEPILFVCWIRPFLTSGSTRVNLHLSTIL